MHICPAYAGMILPAEKDMDLQSDLSRVCGDDPVQAVRLSAFKQFVPRMRG